MNDQQCPCFKGNLALLRVCAVIFIASVFNIIVSMLLSAVHEGLLVSLWSAFTTSSFEDLLSMFLLFIVSGVAIPIGLGVLAVLGVLALAIYTLVKKKVTILKVFSVLFYIWFVAGSFALDPMKDLLGSQNFASIIVNSIFNVYVVVAVATFFIESKKHADENVNEVVAEKFNVGLFRFCAACFFVCGLNGVTQLICGQTSFLSFALFGILALIASVLALVKKSAAFLMLGSLIMLVQICWSVLQIFCVEGWNFYTLFSMIVHSLLHAMTVVCIAAFFIEPERTKCYLQKVKHAFSFCKK